MSEGSDSKVAILRQKSPHLHLRSSRSASMTMLAGLSSVSKSTSAAKEMSSFAKV